MRRNDIYIVPADQRADYNLLVQRANRRIKRGLEYAQKELGIKDRDTIISIFGDYGYEQTTTPFSRGVKFANEATYNRYIKRLEKWGSKTPPNVIDPVKYVTDKAIKQKRKGYIQAITQALNTLASDNGVQLENGKLPAGLYDRITKLSTEQLKHFFDNDPADMIDSLRWSSQDYEGATTEEFIDITTGHINALRATYKQTRKRKATPKKKKKNRKKKNKKRRK